ncbi:hypothetical protein DRO61_08755 [Candidatus Bathyarchaeota archaeon]|nr:MAG: hypothetical protein DRO61_08755 [Candidatus Bathyarchaeota archaeon]
MALRKFNGTDLEDHRICVKIYESGTDPSDSLDEAMVKVMKYSKGCVNPHHVKMILEEYGFTS